MQTIDANRLLLVDGMALLFRSFYAMGRANLTAPDGTPIGAVFGFLRALIKTMRDQQPSHVAVAWEPGGKNFRHEIFPEYKANRKPAPEEIKVQIPLIQQLLREFNLPSMSVPGFEGDDLIGTLATRFSLSGEVLILSSDKDFMQLVTDKVKIFSLKKGDEYEIIGPQGVVDFFRVPPNKVIDLLSLTGDTSDNVPGVAGIGDKKAAELINQFGSLDEVFGRLAEIPDVRKRNALAAGKESAILSRSLVTINCSVPMDLSEEKLRYTMDDLARASLGRTRLQELRMSSILRSIEDWNPQATDAPVSASAQQSKKQENVSNEDSEPTQAQTIFDFGATSTPAPTWGKRDYRMVLSRADLVELCQRIASPTTKVFAFDTETTGLDIIEDIPIGASFSFAKGEAFYVPAHPQYQASAALNSTLPSPECTASEVWSSISKAFAERSAIAVAHNLKFDLHQLCNVNVCLGSAPLACSMVAAWLCDPTSGGYGLDPQTMQLLGLTKIPTSQLIGKESGRSSMLEVPLSTLVEYACEDADATLRIWHELVEKMERAEVAKLFWDMEMPVLQVLAAMERTGVYIDSSYLKQLLHETRSSLADLEQRIFALAGCTFNVASPKQLGVVLFEQLKVHERLGFKGKLAKTTLGFKTDAATLEQFSSHPMVELVLEYRELSKLINTYIDVLPRLVKQETGRIHTDFNQIGTATGRLSSSDPNLQNIPVRTAIGRKVRSAFCASRKQNILTVVDYSQIELRVLAHLSQDANMIDAFQRGVDIHRETAAKLGGKAPESVSDEERSAAKAINFGIIYGMGAQRLARSQGISQNQAKSFIDRYFATFAGVKNYLDKQRAEAHNTGLVRTFFGRPRPIRDLNNSNPAIARSAENIAVNTPVQGTAADIMKRGMIGVAAELCKRQLATKLLLQVHDELVLEGPREEADEVAKLVKQSLERAVEFSCPLVAEVGQGANWLEAK